VLVNDRDGLGLEKATENPWEDVGYAWEHSPRGEEDTEIADADRFARGEEDVTDAANAGEEDQRVATLLDAVGDPGREDGDQERKEVRWCGEALGVDGSKAHLVEDRRQENGQRRETDVAAEVHELSANQCLISIA